MQLLLLTLDEGYLLTAAPPDLGRVVAPLGPPVPMQPLLLGRKVMINLESILAQTVKRLPTLWETWVQSLCWEDPLGKEMATHSSILVWKIPWMEEPGRI